MIALFRVNSETQHLEAINGLSLDFDLFDFLILSSNDQ